jgi:hypothetical protein
MSAMPAIENPKSKIQNRRAPKPMAAWQRSRLFGYWKELSASVAADYTDRADPERAARLAYATEKLGTPIESWSKLGMGQAGKLIAAMRKDLHRDEGAVGSRQSAVGSKRTAKPDALEIIARLSLELYGRDWNEALRDRLTERPFFHYAALSEITPWQSHELIEILFDHLERKLFPDDAGMDVRKQRKEELRKHFSPRRH